MAKDNKQELIDTLFRSKPVSILIALKYNDNIYASSLAKKVDCTYSHVVKVLNIFEKDGIVRFNKEGRLKRLSLTEKGLNICKLVLDIQKIIDED